MSGSTYAVSMCAVGYEALTNYRNSAGTCGQLLVEPLYLGLALGGTVETAARLVVAVVIKGVFFVGCYIPLNCVDSRLDDVQQAFDWTRASILTCGSTTVASLLSSIHNLMSTEPLDTDAQRQTVEKFAEKHLVNDVHFGIVRASAKPFSLAILKAITTWRNDFIDEKTREVFRSTKIFKQICAVPLYMGVAVLGHLESTARAAYSVAIVALLIAVFFSVGLAVPPLLLSLCLGNMFPFIPNNFGTRIFAHVEWLADHFIGMTVSSAYSLGVMGAALISLKDNFMKHPDRVGEPGQIYTKKQIDRAAELFRACLANNQALFDGMAKAVESLPFPIYVFGCVMTSLGMIFNNPFLLLIGVPCMLAFPLAAIAYGTYYLAVGACKATLVASECLLECLSPSSYY
jgi:hypothetical protein